MPLSKKLTAEFLGTLWLVLGGCGSAVIAAAYPNLGIGFAGVALAFGLTVLTGAYALGHVSGAHFNPAVSIGLWAGKRFPAKDLIPYIIAQLLGAIAASGILYIIANGKAGFGFAGGFASNGFGDHSPAKYVAMACFVAEVVMTFFFVFVILGSTHGKAPRGFAPDRDRPLSDADPLDNDTGHEYVREPGSFDRPGTICRPLLRPVGTQAALDVLASADLGGSPRRFCF